MCPTASAATRRLRSTPAAVLPCRYLPSTSSHSRWTDERAPVTSISTLVMSRRSLAPMSRITVLGGGLVAPTSCFMAVADRGGVGVEQRRLEAEHEQAGGALVVGMTIDVAVGAGRVGDLAEGAQVRSGCVPDNEQQH